MLLNSLIFVLHLSEIKLYQFEITQYFFNINLPYCKKIKSYLKTKSFISVNCDEGWLTYDNSCYKHKLGSATTTTTITTTMTTTTTTTTTTMMKPSDGQTRCINDLDSNLFVPNSRLETIFIAAYLSAVKVITLQWKSLNVITFGQRETDYTKGLIIISKLT